MNTTEKEKKKFHYGWVVFAACILMIFVTLGFCSSVKSLYHRIHCRKIVCQFQGHVFTNYIFDVFRTYKGILLIYAAIMAVLIFVMDRMIVTARKDRAGA